MEYDFSARHLVVRNVRSVSTEVFQDTGLSAAGFDPRFSLHKGEMSVATLWNRATPSQYRMLRAIAGAVCNAAHAHHLELPRNFARSVAKRATGTLTAQWPDVLAAKAKRRHERLRETSLSRDLMGPDPRQGPSNGDRLRTNRRSPIRIVWRRYASGMRRLKHGKPEVFAAHVRVLKLLDQAQRELDAIEYLPNESADQ